MFIWNDLKVCERLIIFTLTTLSTLTTAKNHESENTSETLSLHLDG